MAAIPYIAQLPLRLPDAGSFNLFPGQLLRARVTALNDGQVTLDLGYTAIKANLSGGDLAIGERVLIRVGAVGPDQLALQIISDSPSPAIAAPIAPTPESILAGLGFPDGDPLLGLAAQLEQTPAAAQMPPAILAGLVLAFGSDAATFLPQVAQLLMPRRPGEPDPLTRGQLDSDRTAVQGTTDLLTELLSAKETDLPGLLTHPNGALPLDNPSLALSLAASALAGHAVRLHYASDQHARLLIEEQGRPNTDTPTTYRFLAQLDLPSLGSVGMACLYAPSACIARVTGHPEALRRLEGPLDEARTNLQTRIGRPMHITLTEGAPIEPLETWLEEQPWRHRGSGGMESGGWVDRFI